MEQWTQTSNKSFPQGSGFSSSRSSSATTRVSIINNNNNIIDLAPVATKKAFKIPHGNEKRRNGKTQDVRGREGKVLNAVRHTRNNNLTHNPEGEQGSGFQYTLTNKGHDPTGMDASKNNAGQNSPGFQGRPAIRPMASPRGGNQSKNPQDIRLTTAMKKPDPSALRINPLIKISPDVRLGLAGDRLGRGMLDQHRGQGGVKAISRSSTKTTFGSAKYGTSPSPSGMSQGRHCDACAVEYVRHWLKANPSSHSHDSAGTSAVKSQTTSEAKESEEGHHQEPEPEAHAYHEPLQLLKTGEEEAIQAITRHMELKDFLMSEYYRSSRTERSRLARNRGAWQGFRSHGL